MSRTRIAALLTMLFILVVTGCGSDDKSADEGGSGDFVIGVAGAQTGYLAPFDQGGVAGLKTIVGEINARGGLLGKHKIKLLVRDTRSDVAQAAILAQEFVDKGVHAAVFPCDADPAIAGGQITQKAKIPAFSICATTPTFALSVGDYMFGMFHGDHDTGAVMAKQALDDGCKRVFTLASNETTYTKTVVQYFELAFTHLGGEVVGRQQFAFDQQEFGPEIAKIRDVAPDCIETSMYEPMFPAFVKQLRAADLDIPIIGNDSLESPTITALGSVVDGLIYPINGFVEPGSEFEKFAKKVTAKFGDDLGLPYAASGADIGLVLEAAAKKANSIEGPALRDAIASLKDVKGVSGTITYAGRANRQPIREIYIVRLQDGKKHLLKSVIPDPETVPDPEQ
jgi:branched-chain amino acid transport system substrate-binding protein